MIVVVVYQNWIHTEKIDWLGIFDSWFNTPLAHRVHHGSNPVTINIIEYKKIWQDMRRCHSLRDKLHILFGGTNWRPAYFSAEKTEQNK